MHILIDRERLVVLYKHNNLGALCNIAHIEAAHSAVVIAHYSESERSFGDLTDWELRLIYENLCGQKYQGYLRDHLERSVIALCDAIPESDINIHEAFVQAACIAEGDDRYYTYVRGSQFPSPQEDLFAAPALRVAQGFVPSVPINAPVLTQPAPATQAAAAWFNIPRKPQEDTRTPRDPNAPSRIESNEPPKQGSKTGRVWEIADAVLAKYSAPYDWKKLRADIAAACEAEGINSSTMSVQSSKWRKTKGI